MNWDAIFARRSRVVIDYAAFLKAAGFSKTFKIINVIGTNGKGSVSNFLAQGLRSKGYKVGLFTSPHVVLPNERIQINGTVITDDEFASLMRELGEEKLLTFNFFAITYLVAMMYFYRASCDYVVLEAGIGGNMDITKTIPGDFGVVTSISLDHTDLLGDTVEAIATDKAGIIHPQMHFFIPAIMAPHLQAIFKKRTVFYRIIDNAGPTYREQNARLASGILKTFGITFTNFKLPPGRTEVRQHNSQTTIIDVAHNYDGVFHSLAYLRRSKIMFAQTLLTLKRTKDANGIPDLFKNTPLYVYQPSNEFYSASELGGIEVPNLLVFLKHQNVATLYIGSFTLAGAVLSAL